MVYDRRAFSDGNCPEVSASMVFGKTCVGVFFTEGSSAEVSYMRVYAEVSFLTLLRSPDGPEISVVNRIFDAHQDPCLFFNVWIHVKFIS
jgi:hypothetical protein